MGELGIIKKGGGAGLKKAAEFSVTCQSNTQLQLTFGTDAAALLDGTTYLLKVTWSSCSINYTESSIEIWIICRKYSSSGSHWLSPTSPQKAIALAKETNGTITGPSNSEHIGTDCDTSKMRIISLAANGYNAADAYGINFNSSGTGKAILYEYPE